MIVEPPNDLSDNAPLDAQGISFLYYEILGDKPQEYEIQALLESASQCGLRSIGEARLGLTGEVIMRMKEINDARFPGVPMGSQILACGFAFAARGPVAFEEYRKDVEAEWADIERIGRAEVLAELPDTFEEFIEDLKLGHVSWQAIQELGGVKECGRCGADILVVDAAAEAVLDHYGFPETDEDVEQLLLRAMESCPWEEESVDSWGFCPYCAHMMSKDD